MQKLNIAQLEVVVNTTCNINSAILIGQDKIVQHSSSLTLNTAMLKH